MEVKNKKGNSPLWLAANGGHLEVVQLLYSSTADIDSEDNRKVSCLMAAFKRGHYKVVKYMVRNVSQFPSDTELQRYIATLGDKELITKCTNCLEVIRAAKDKQALEANKNASILLEELEQERSREESKKAAASRRRLKKKAKKLEKKEEKRRLEEIKRTDDGSDDEEEEENGNNEDHEHHHHEEQTKREKNEANALQRVVEQIAPEEKDGDSGIDSNSQTSATSETKVTDEKESKPGKRTKKRRKESSAKESTIANQKQNETSSTVPNCETNDVKKSSLNTNSIQPQSSASNTSVSKSKKKKEEENKSSGIMNELDIFHLENVKSSNNKKSSHDSSRVNALDTFGEVDHYVTPIPGLVGSASTTLSAPSLSPNAKSAPGLGTSPKKGTRREEGWKEVSRKAKKVAVPNSAISRVIGRGGCNINTIREVSGAHIEVEKQGKSQGDRMISIKGSTEATRQAQNLISALVKDPDKDLSELIPKSVAKVPPKPPKISLESSVAQSNNKSLRPASTIGISMATVTSSTVSITMAKSGTTTTTAWSNAVSSPKRTPAQARPVSTGGPPNSSSKSPAVRQLFGEKKSVPTTSSAAKVAIVSHSVNASVSSDTLQTFAAKLADPKSSTKSSTPPLVASPKPSTHPAGLANSVVNSSEGVAGEDKNVPETNNNGMVSQQYSIFHNRLSQVTHEAVWGAKEKQVNFASVAAAGLVPNGNNKHPPQVLQQHQHMAHGSVNTYMEPVEEPPTVDATRAPGYRGTTSTVTVSSHMGTVASGSPPNSVPVPMPLSGPHPAVATSMARSAPGTPVASPSMRPIAPPPTRQTATPPPMPRSSLEMGGPPFTLLPGPSRTPPPVLSPLMRLPLPSASLGPGAPLPARGHLTQSGMNMGQQQPYSGVSIASLAPGGPVSSIPRGPIPPPDPSDLVNLAPGQPYRKPPPPPLEVAMGSFHPQKQQHPQLSSLAQLTGMMNGPRFTTPQTNPHPVFTNNILAPISAAPQIQSNLNPNAPDFTSRSGAFVPPTYPPRSQLAAFQNGAPTVTPSLGSGFGGIGQFPAGLDATLSLPGAFSEVMSGLIPRNPPPLAPIPASVGGNAAFRNSGTSQDSSSPLASPHSSNPASPTQSASSASAGGLAQLPEERHAKLQPIGTERAQKRSERLGVVSNDMLWSMPLPEMLPATPLDHNLPAANPYYNDLDISQYGQVSGGFGHMLHNITVKYNDTG